MTALEQMELDRDKARLDWLSKYTSRLQDVYWHIENEGGTVREAVDYFMREYPNE